mmetsp:Transcript_1710/g.4809  ORF Transcript_1710/g.4809 Transcript_1710/m.4809 type:complete len:84 (-) Transcript_1710:183-434(-)
MRSRVEPLSDEMHVVGLDAEWDTPKDANGFFVGVPSKVKVIQLAYCPCANTPAHVFELAAGHVADGDARGLIVLVARDRIQPI